MCFDFEKKLRFYQFKQMGVWILTGAAWQAYLHVDKIDSGIRREVLKEMSDK